MRVFDYDKQKSQREYYLRNVVFWGLLVAYIPSVAFVGTLLQQGLGYVALSWLAGLIIVGAWRISWPCPRCHRRFYFKKWYGNTFSTKCVHCGFRPGSQ